MTHPTMLSKAGSERMRAALARKRYGVPAAIALLLVAIAPPIAGVHYLERVELRHAGEGLAVAAAGATDELALLLHAHVTELSTLAKVLAQPGASLDDTHEPLLALKEGSAFLTAVAVTDGAGRVVSATDDAMVGLERGDRAWFSRARTSDGPELIDMQPSEEAGGATVLTVALAIKDIGGGFRGMLFAQIGLTPVEATLARRVNELQAQLPGAGRVEWILLRDDGSVISDASGTRQGHNLKDGGHLSGRRSDAAGSGFVEEQDGARRIMTGYAHLSGATNAEEMHWRVLLQRDRGEVLARLHRLVGFVALAIGIVLLPVLAALVAAQRARQRAEAARNLAHTRLQAIVEHARDAIVVMDIDGRIRDYNPAAERMFGWTPEEAIDRDLADLIIPEAQRAAHRRGLAHYRRTGEGQMIGKQVELTALRRGGQTFPIEISVVTLPTPETTLFSAMIRDITSRRELEMDLRQAQKLESVGQLAAGVAHEINTPIQFVGDNVRFLEGGFTSLLGLVKECLSACEQHDAPEFQSVRKAAEASDLEYLEEEIPRAIAQTCDGVERVATIVRAMKEFAHSGGKEKAPADLNQAIRSTLTVARNELKYVADVQTELGPLPAVECCMGDLNQVFLNLFINAAHAITDVVKGTETRGTIRVTTRTDGDAVVIAVSDTGGGIPAAIQSKIFDPFFTTKEVGRGSGQGLAIARSIVVEKHGGTLTFETEAGHGTTFFIKLPIEAPAPADAPGAGETDGLGLASA